MARRRAYTFVWGAGSIPASEPAILEMLHGTSRGPFERAASVGQSLTLDVAAGVLGEAGIPFGDRKRRSLGAGRR